jgi:FdhD protein
MADSRSLPRDPGDAPHDRASDAPATDGPAPHQGLVTRPLDGGGEDELVREEPLLIVAGTTQLLTMRTPGTDLDLVTGFLCSEGAVQGTGGILEVSLRPAAEAPADARDPVDEAHVRVTEAARPRLEGRLTRTHEIRSSCGVCGLTDPEQILEDTPPLLPGVPRLDLQQLEDMRARFEAAQSLFHRTGACHGAAVFSADGRLCTLGEDVGRHNALDKALGRALREGYVLDRSVVLLSGRAGYDLVVKCLRLRVPVIASVSAPSSLAFDLCDAAGATLVGFLRPGRAKIYTDTTGRLS